MDSESNKRESNSHRSACGRSLKIAIVTTLLVCITTLAVYSLYPTRGTLRNLFQPHGQSSSDVEQSSSALISVEPQLQPSEETVSLSYGPFNIKQATMMPEVVLQGIKKPCDDCSITAMRATLINSSSQLPLAPDTGIHLHHIIFFNDGVADLVCPEMGERFFGSGDVRWTLRWNSHGDYGYKVKAEDRWDTVVELMNDAEWEGEVEIQVLFEVDAGMSEVRPVWLDATGCGRSDVDVKSTTEPFEYTTPEWISSVSGTLLGIAAHQHNGGIDMTGYLNGDQLCRSTQLYSSQTTKQHISAVGVCKNIGRIRPGDRLWSEARYDPVLHHLTMRHGHPDPVMASMGIYIGIE